LRNDRIHELDGVQEQQIKVDRLGDEVVGDRDDHLAAFVVDACIMRVRERTIVDHQVRGLHVEWNRMELARLGSRTSTITESHGLELGKVLALRETEVMLVGRVVGRHRR